MKRKYSTPESVNNTGLSEDLPLFIWANLRPELPQPSRASQRLAKRFGISPSLARAVAELAGLPSEIPEHA